MRLLLTRPLQDSQHLASILKKRGHESVISPLLEISYLEVRGVLEQNIQSIIATSRHGLVGLSRIGNFERLLGKPVFAVGQSTTEIAGKFGFSNIFQGSGNASGLVGLICDNCQPDQGILLYPRGSHVAFDMEQQISSLGFSVSSPIVYNSRAVSSLSDKAWKELEMRTLGGVLLLSPRTAQLFSDLVLTRQSVTFARNLNYYCLSKQVVDNISIPDIKNIYAPTLPKLEELLDLIDKYDVGFQ